MENVSSPGEFAEQSENAADRTANTLQNGIDSAAETLADTVESVRAQVKPIVGKVGTAAQQAWDATVGVSDSVVNYTKDNPVKALAIAAALGALLSTLLSAISSSAVD